MNKIILSFSLIVLLAAGCNQKTDNTQQSEINTNSPVNQTKPVSETQPSIQTVEFSKFNSVYKFSGEISNSWVAEYVPSIESVNIYDPAKAGITNIEKSVIFIRYFNANSFLTLNTVSILNRADATVSGHAAVRYEIKNKSGVANFPSQPPWRNGQHKLIDIRYSQTNPSPFYVIAYNPELPAEQFEAFIAGLIFHNDSSSLRYPITKPNERVTKKLFGTKVSPTNSPIQPERFTGYHNAVDFEILPGEEQQLIKVTALCGGNLISKRKVSGYGGLATQSCRINNQLVTVIYGHLELASISESPNSYLAPGDFIGYLGAANSTDTDGERKHLHLGIRKGQSSDVKGYVDTEAELLDWIDLQKLII